MRRDEAVEAVRRGRRILRRLQVVAEAERRAHGVVLDVRDALALRRIADAIDGHVRGDHVDRREREADGAADALDVRLVGRRRSVVETDHDVLERRRGHGRRGACDQCDRTDGKRSEERFHSEKTPCR